MEKDSSETQPTPKPKKSQPHSNTRIVYENACIDRGLAYYDYENFEIPWE
jgi:hypothetical protein